MLNDLNSWQSLTLQYAGTALNLASWMCVMLGNAKRTYWFLPKYPWNYVAEVLGCFLWVIAGIGVMNGPLILLNVVVGLFALIGIITNRGYDKTK